MTSTCSMTSGLVRLHEPKYGGMHVSDAKRLKTLESENRVTLHADALCQVSIAHRLTRHGQRRAASLFNELVTQDACRPSAAADCLLLLGKRPSSHLGETECAGYCFPLGASAGFT